MNKENRIILIIFIVLALGAVGLGIILKSYYIKKNTNFTKVEIQDDKSMVLTIDLGKENPNKLPVLIDFGSDSCEPCVKMKPVLNELAKEYKGKLIVKFYDSKKDKNQFKKYGINGIPAQMFFDSNGKQIFKHIGFYSKEDIIKKFEEMGIKLS